MDFEGLFDEVKEELSMEGDTYSLSDIKECYDELISRLGVVESHHQALGDSDKERFSDQKKVVDQAKEVMVIEFEDLMRDYEGSQGDVDVENDALDLSSHMAELDEALKTYNQVTYSPRHKLGFG